MSASTWLGGSGFAPRPFRGWLQRAPRVRAVGAWLAPTGPDPRADALESLADKCGMAQQQAFQVLRQRGQAVLEVGLRCRLPGPRPARLPHVGVAVGEQPRHGDQIEVREQFLLHQPLAAAVELIHLQELLAHLVQLFDPPAGMVQVGQVSHAIAAAVKQGGAEDVLGPAVGVLDEAQRDGLARAAGMLAGQVPQGLGAGQDRHDGVGLVAGDEAVDRRAGVAAHAEDRVQAVLAVGAEQLEGVVAAVVDDDVAGLQGLEMGERGGALVVVGAEVEIDREPGLQAVQAAEQALGVVGLRAGGVVAGVDQRPRQAELGAVDGEYAVAQPERPGLLGAAQDRGVELPEGVLVDLGPGLAHGGVGDRLRLRQGHVQGGALGP